MLPGIRFRRDSFYLISASKFYKRVDSNIRTARLYTNDKALCSKISFTSSFKVLASMWTTSHIFKPSSCLWVISLLSIFWLKIRAINIYISIVFVTQTLCRGRLVLRTSSVKINDLLLMAIANSRAWDYLDAAVVWEFLKRYSHIIQSD